MWLTFFRLRKPQVTPWSSVTLEKMIITYSKQSLLFMAIEALLLSLRQLAKDPIHLRFLCPYRLTLTYIFGKQSMWSGSHSCDSGQIKREGTFGFCNRQRISWSTVQLSASQSPGYMKVVIDDINLHKCSCHEGL